MELEDIKKKVSEMELNIDLFLGSAFWKWEDIIQLTKDAVDFFDFVRDEIDSLDSKDIYYFIEKPKIAYHGIDDAIYYYKIYNGK